MRFQKSSPRGTLPELFTLEIVKKAMKILRKWHKISAKVVIYGEIETWQLMQPEKSFVLLCAAPVTVRGNL